MDQRISRRKALKMAGAAALGGLAMSAGGVMPRIGFAQETPDEPWEKYIDVELAIAMSSMYFQLEGQDKNAPITLEAGKTYLLSFHNDETGDVAHNAHLGKDPDLDNRHFKTSLIENFFGIELDPGNTGEIVIKVTDAMKGDWEIGCFISGHYEAGMHCPLIVK